jgi:RNA polymerase sigma-70 factor, ECF subfamily
VLELKGLNTHDEDHELMARIALRDKDAYRLLVNKYLGLCVRFAERILGNRQDAEDIAQETCLKIWRNPDSWKQQSKFSTWLCRVIVNACIDHKRKVIPFATVEMKALHDHSEAVDEVLIARQKADNMQHMLQQLPYRQRAALVLSYYEELSNQQSADALGISVLAVQQLLFRARQNLKLILTEERLEQGNE